MRHEPRSTLRARTCNLGKLPSPRRESLPTVAGMSSDKPRQRETKPDRSTPDNQRAMFLDALRGTTVDNWQELAAEVLAAGRWAPPVSGGWASGA